MKLSRTTANQWMIVLVSILAFAYVVFRLTDYNNWNEISTAFLSRKWMALAYIGLQLFLLAINQILEAGKWHLLVNTTHTQPFARSIIQTLGGATLGVITPARLGEPAGRLYLIPKEKRLKAIVLGFLGGMILTIVIVISGVLALLINNPLQGHFSLNLSLQTIVIFIIPVTGIWIWYRFYRPEPASNLIRKFRNSFRLTNRRQLFHLFIITFARYVCFSAQLLIWFHFFSPATSVVTLISPLAVYYLIVTIIPSFILADLGIRGSVGVVIFSLQGINLGIIVSAIFCQWLITVCLPAIIGGGVHLSHSRRQ